MTSAPQVPGRAPARTPKKSPRPRRSAMRTATGNSYTKTLTVETTAEEVFYALSDPGAITSWWSAAAATGSGQTGGELHITFGTRATTDCHARARRPPSGCGDLGRGGQPTCTGVGRHTTDVHDDAGRRRCRVDFAHHGLVPALECVDRCTVYRAEVRTFRDRLYHVSSWRSCLVMPWVSATVRPRVRQQGTRAPGARPSRRRRRRKRPA